MTTPITREVSLIPMSAVIVKSTTLSSEPITGSCWVTKHGDILRGPHKTYGTHSECYGRGWILVAFEAGNWRVQTILAPCSKIRARLEAICQRIVFAAGDSATVKAGTGEHYVVYGWSGTSLIDGRGNPIC